MPATSDVYIGGSETYIATLATPLMVLDQVDWSSYFSADRSGRGSLKGAALEISGRFPGIVYNTKLIRQKRRAEKSQAIFCMPKFKGKVSTQPYISYFDILRRPEAVGPGTNRRLRQETLRPGFRPDALRRVRARRQRRISDPCAGLRRGRRPAVHRERRAAEYVIPSDAAMVTHRYCAVPKNAQSKAAAKLFCAFLMTKSGQEFQWNVDRQDSEKFPGTRYYPK